MKQQWLLYLMPRQLVTTMLQTGNAFRTLAQHMCNGRGNFVSFTPAEGAVKIENNDKNPSKGVGTVKLVSVVAGKKNILRL